MLDTSDYSFGYIAGWSSDKEIAELKASLSTIRTAASELITGIDGHFAELQQQREAATPVMDKASPEQRQALENEVRQTLQMFVDTDMKTHGQLTQGTLAAIATQGYAYQDGQLVKGRAAPLIDTPDVIAADVFDLMRDFDPEFMQKYADRRDEQITATLHDIQNGNTIPIEGTLIYISQDETTPTSFRARADDLMLRIDNYKELNNTFSIYQLKGGEETRPYRFEPLDQLEMAGLSVNKGNYDLVYTAPLSDIETLEDIYRRFNNDHPKDFTGHSLSVSDVVILRHGDRQTAHYCDSYGFREVPQFLQERQRQQENPLKTAELPTEQNENMIDGRINNTPSVGELEAKVKAEKQSRFPILPTPSRTRAKLNTASHRKSRPSGRSSKPIKTRRRDRKRHGKNRRNRKERYEHGTFYR